MRRLEKEGVPNRFANSDIVNDEQLLEHAEELSELLAVVRVQRAWRERQTVFRLFGHQLFVRSQEERSNYGTLQFPGDNDAPSPFLVCSDKTSAVLLATFLAHGPWALERPGLLIVVAGGAQNFTLHPPRLAHLFTKGVADAARDARAVITTAGTDSGVAKLVAAAMQTMNVKQPVIGVAPFRKVPRDNAARY